MFITKFFKKKAVITVSNDIKQKRLNAIVAIVIEKKKHLPSCPCCGKTFEVGQRAFFVKRWHPSNPNKTVNCFYCTNCTPTAEAVLNEIDTDDFPTGIYRVDSMENFTGYGKKPEPDYTVPHDILN